MVAFSAVTVSSFLLVNLGGGNQVLDVNIKLNKRARPFSKLAGYPLSSHNSVYLLQITSRDDVATEVQVGIQEQDLSANLQQVLHPILQQSEGEFSSSWEHLLLLPQSGAEYQHQVGIRKQKLSANLQ